PERAAESLESKYKKVYVACPSFIKTGGPELLHQLVYWLNHYFGNAVIAYLDYGEEKRAKVPFSHPEFFHYVCGSAELFEEIEDSPENVLVVPEGWSLTCTKVKNMKQMFWWLSVDNFIASVTYGGQDDQENTKKVLNMLENVIDLHLVQSEYAGDYIRKNGFPDDRIEYLSDYINQTYLDNADTALECPKEDIVLYNPKKGFDFVEKVMKVSPDLQWRAIEKMTTIQVGELMRKAKVYIDFGNHPGKDRIPREAAVSGCIVITGRKGSAAYFEDVPIPEKYKIAEEEGSAEKVAHVIRQSIKDYDTLIHDFDDYRARILSEKERFIKDAIRIFGK
ncbi:MAG: hypothetical protein K6E33_03875, partial [Lachnospiraceae bacterium]|nr:hypothetical protein [Lachnospiraceae bacterium]